MKRFVAVAVAALTFGLLAPVIANAQGIETPTPGRYLESESPGSVLIAHKFIRGSVIVGNTGTADIFAPRSEFEVGYVCPAGTPLSACPASITVRAHWVCPGRKATNNEDFLSCAETDWFFSITRHGKVYFSPEAEDVPTPNNQASRGPGNLAGFVAQPPCEKGYLIMWVVTSPDDPTPISANVLIGEAILRNEGGSAGAYNMVAVASPQPPLTPLSYPLSFDGVSYQLLPTQVVTDVRYDRLSLVAPNAAGVAQLGAITSHLTLLTVDVWSNLEANYPVTLAINAYNEQERSISDAIEFICWIQIPLARARDGVLPVNPQFNELGRNSRKGVIESRDAFAFNPFTGEFKGFRTVLGIVEVYEHFGAAGTNITREYSYNMFHPRRYAPTQFFPFFF